MFIGWYNEREEMFITELEAELTNFVDPGTNLPLKKVVEESYFFRMSKYEAALISHIEENPLFIQPEQHRNRLANLIILIFFFSILMRLKKEGLKDLSISRTSFTWVLFFFFYISFFSIKYI